MKNLTEAQVKSLLPRAVDIELKKGQVLFNEGDPISFFFYVERGKIEEVGTLPDGRHNIPRRAGPGDYVGRYAAVTGQPSPIAATAVEDTGLLAIPLRDLQPILFSYPNWQNWFFRTDVAARLRAVPLFRQFDDWDLYFLADRTEPLNYQAGETIYRAGDPPDGLYVIDQGQVVETLSATARPADDWPRYYATGNSFGRYALQRGDPRQATATARVPTRVFRIPHQTLKEIWQTRSIDLSQELDHIDIVGLLGRIGLFSGLTPDNVRLLAGYVYTIYHRPGEIVSRQGEPATSLMILADGEAIIRRQVGQGQPRPVGYFKAQTSQGPPSVQSQWSEIPYFGDHALLHEELRGASIEVTKPSIWIVLQREDLRRFLADAGLTLDDLQKTTRPAMKEEAKPPSQADRLALPLTTKRHWIVPVTRVLPLAIVTVGLLLLVLGETFLGQATGFRSVAIGVGLVSLVLLIPWTLWNYLNWLNDTLEVNNQVVAHTERVPFPFPREDRNEAPLEQIQNVTTTTSALGQILGYGKVSVDTAALRGQVQFSATPDPTAVQELIQQAAAQARSGQQVQLQESIRRNLEGGLYPQRLKPEVPESVLMSAEGTPTPGPPAPKKRKGRTWLRFEIWEQDRVTWRKHWLNLVQRDGVPAILFLITGYLTFAYTLAFVTDALGFADPIELPPVSLFGFQGYLCIPVGVLWVFATLWVIYQYQDWSNDVYIVTNNEVIDVERKLAIFPFWFIFTESRRQAPLARVQNVNLKIPNLAATLFGYGDVIVQTAGTEGTLDFLFVSNPRRVQAEVIRRLSAYQESQQQREFEDRWGSMGQWFKAYHDLTGPEGGD